MTTPSYMGRGSRTRTPITPADPEKIGLPARPFLYTVDQISVILDIEETQIKSKYIYFEGRSIGVARRDLLIARNIAPDDAKPDWRIAERELIRWLKYKGFKYYERGVVKY